MARALFEWELEEHVESYIQSKRDDGDAYLFAVTEHSGDVAMILVDKDDSALVNEAARTRLQELWPDPAYRRNLEYFIPQMVQELSAGRIFYAGVKVAADRLRRKTGLDERRGCASRVERIRSWLIRR